VAESISLSSAWLPPQAAHCEVSGSAAAENAVGVASINTATGTFGANDGAGFADETINPPAQAIAGFTYALTLSTVEPFNADGEASFKIFGTMSIPPELQDVHYGGYQSPVILVTFNDQL
jgi:hypothetical protein